MSRTRRSSIGPDLLFYLIVIVGAVLVILSGCGKAAAPPPAVDRYQMSRIEERFGQGFENLIVALVSHPTFRDRSMPPGEAEQRVIAQMAGIQADFNYDMAAFNKVQQCLTLEPFEWSGAADGPVKWVFGYRLGTGPRKIAFVAHLDTVPPGDGFPRALDPYLEDRELRGKKTRFIVGRGALDDKGPAVIGLQVMQALARRFDSTPETLQGVTFELVLDTSEETGMSMPHYFKAAGAPATGIVMDAEWCVVAEKGIERPVFRIALTEKRKGDLWIESLSTPRGAVNQIPDSATLRVRGKKARLDQFAAGVSAWYKGWCDFGFKKDDFCHRAPPKVAREKDAVVLTVDAQGAQHGSAPEFNRKYGVNPLVVLANFAAYLAPTGSKGPEGPSVELADNSLAKMAHFIVWTWGADVFGERSPEQLARHDRVFQEGNGTTYALTRFYTEPDHAELHVDIRYALGHHATEWDGRTAGMLAGESVFKSAFTAVVDAFNAFYSSANLRANVSFTTRTVFAPDLKDPNSPGFQSMFAAYQAMTGEECPRHAIGGGTDAKGFPQLMAMGPTFGKPGEDWMGPPRNYHGRSEGVPIEDLTRSARIYYRWAVDQVLGK